MTWGAVDSARIDWTEVGFGVDEVMLRRIDAAVARRRAVMAVMVDLRKREERERSGFWIVT